MVIWFLVLLDSWSFPLSLVLPLGMIFVYMVFCSLLWLPTILLVNSAGFNSFVFVAPSLLASWAASFIL